MPEYDPLADLYDLEYTHDYDLPLWSALAKREGTGMPGPKQVAKQFARWRKKLRVEG